MQKELAMSKHNRAILLGITIMASSTGLGCASWSKPAPGGKSWNPTTWFKKEYQEPGSVATIWKPDRMAEPGQLERRGFAGVVYFYNDRSQAVPVEGELVVHGYLTTPNGRRNSQQNEQADQKFVFGAEQMAKQFAPSELGASYSIWVPWDNNEFREEVTLIATFKSKKGTVVQSSPTKLTLPGTSRYPEQSEPTETTRLNAKPVGYEKGSIPSYDLKPPVPQIASTRITTIEVPRSSKLSQPPQQTSVNVGGEGSFPQLDGQGVSVGGSIGRQPAGPQYNLQQLSPPPLR
jgi:hypothetical protein